MPFCAEVYRCAGLGVQFAQVIEETISKIEERLRAADSLSSAQRAELQDLLAQLRTEARSLPPEAVPAEADEDEDVQSAISRLEESLAAFETSHPQITGLVNRISAILANMGI